MVLTNNGDAKDIDQECFFRVWKKLARYNEKAKFTKWMYKIVINLCYDKLRMSKAGKTSRPQQYSMQVNSGQVLNS